MKLFLLILFLTFGSGLIAACIPLVKYRIKPNHWYGFRVPKTLNNPSVWYPANEYAGKLGVAVGAIVLATALALFWIQGLNFSSYASIVGAVTVIALIVLLIQSLRFVAKLPDDSTPREAAKE